MTVENLRILEQDLEPMLDKDFNFVLQRHTRGESIHLDLRMVAPGEDHLVGLTLDLGDKTKRDKWLKNPTGIQVLVQVKSRQPISWLKVSGEVEPGGIGATKNLPAQFDILDKGKVRYGASKPDEGFYEFFFEGNKVKGRFVTRMLSLPSDGDSKVDGLLFWKPKDQRPYIETHPEYAEELEKTKEDKSDAKKTIPEGKID